MNSKKGDRRRRPFAAAWRKVTAASVLAVPAVAIGLPPPPASADTALTVYASPDGEGSSCSSGSPCSIEGAQVRVRGLAPDMDRDISVVLADGTYRLREPLSFDERDSGHNGHTITWTAASGASPTLSGASRIGGWKQLDGSPIWRAHVPASVKSDPRELYVDGALATRARTQLPRNALTYSADGINIAPSLSYLNDVEQQDRLVIQFSNSFTNRFSPVAKIADNQITMAQPAWNNNTWGWDTVQQPFRQGPVYIANAREFLDQPGEWYFDPQARDLFYQPLPGQNMRGLDVEMPRLESLLSVSGTYDHPAHDLTFAGLTFRGTTWTQPDGPEGYADQQSGAFLWGESGRPQDAFQTCARGCAPFEGRRNTWHQAPAAVQVSAADHITLTDNDYANLGSPSVGVGMDANANTSGVGLGASDIVVSRSLFHDSAGGGIVVGGIQPDAHHPSDERMVNRDITLADNVIRDVAQEYLDQSGILYTYVTRATVTHNEVYNLPYTGIAAGWGWGTNDPGGSAEYLKRGLYNYQPVYETPTTSKDGLVAFNYVHDILQSMNDGGTFYNLSQSPGSVVKENYFLSRNAIGTYFDEGSGFWTSERNVYDVRTPGNTYNAGAGHITYLNNWLLGANAGSFSGPTNTVSGTVLLDRSQVLPLDVSRVVYNAGLSQDLRTSADPARPALWATVSSAKTSLQAGESTTAEVTATNLDQVNSLQDVRAQLALPTGWSAQLDNPSPLTIGPGEQKTIRFTITAPATTAGLIDPASVSAATSWTLHGEPAQGTTTPILLAVTSPVTGYRTFGSVPSAFGEKDGVFAIRNAGSDIWGAGGQSDDEYGTIYAPKAISDGSVMTVRVDSEDGVNAWTKAGLVVRNDLSAPRASTGYAALVVTPSNGITFNWDVNSDGLLDTSTQVRGVQAPVWLRLTRTGNQVQAAYSTSGTTWTNIGGHVTMSNPSASQDGGMIYTSHDRTKTGQATYSQFTLN